MDLYAIILIGLAGRRRSRENGRATAEMINCMHPNHLAAMTYMPVPGTQMYRDIEAGKSYPLTGRESLEETHDLLEGIELVDLHFTSSHASNFLPPEVC